MQKTFVLLVGEWKSPYSCGSQIGGLLESKITKLASKPFCHVVSAYLIVFRMDSNPCDPLVTL